MEKTKLKRVLKSLREKRERNDLACPRCHSSLSKEPMQFEHRGEVYGLFVGETCRQGHTLLTRLSSDIIEQIARDVGHWGRDDRTAA